MKAIGTQMHEAGGSLIPPLAPRTEAGAGDAFQAALAQAMLGAPPIAQMPAAYPATSIDPAKANVASPPEDQIEPAPVVKPIFEPRPIAVTLPIVVQPPVPMPIPVAISIPVVPPPTPTLESRPTTPLMPVAVCAAPPAIEQPAQISPSTSEQEPAPVAPSPAAVPQVAGQFAAPVQIDTAMTTAEPKKKSKSNNESAEPMPAPAPSDTNATQVPLPVMQRPTPAPSVPLDIPAGATPQQLPRGGASSSKTPIDPKSRQATPMPGAGSLQPHALDELLPAKHESPQPAASRPTQAGTTPEHDAPVAEHKAMPASVKIEELHVESAVARPAASKAPAVPATEVKQHEAEPAIGAAGGASAGNGGNVSSHGQRLAYDVPVSTDAPVEARHAQESSRPPAPTDRVTLHLPDDAGGGRIQIAVRGDVVHARIVSADEAGTRELQAGADELRSALTRQGFQETHVRVESGRVAADGWQRGAGMGAAAAGEAAGSGDGRMQDQQSQDRRERHHGAPEDPRSDPRRQHPDGRSQQRARRERER